jgi:hypothetical protein
MIVDSVHGTAVNEARSPAQHVYGDIPNYCERQWSGYTLPCFCTVAPACAKGRPNAFCTGFGILEQGSTSINVHHIIITKGTFSWGGVEYGSHKDH